MNQPSKQTIVWWLQEEKEEQKEVEEGKEGQIHSDGRIGEHTMRYTDDVSQNPILVTYIILLTNIAPITSIKFKNK